MTTGTAACDRVLRDAVRTLTDAGLDSPEADATALLAHAWDRDARAVSRARLLGDPVPAPVVTELQRLLAERSRRVPLQHLTGVAHFRTLTLPVGPGVFIPRPETELLVDAVLSHLTTVAPAGGARVLDLCTGTGALGLAVAAEAAGTSAVGIESSPAALAWTHRGTAASADQLAAAGSTFTALPGDATDTAAVRALLADRWNGPPHVVVSNPPYVVEDGTTTAPEVVDHDPHTALWGGGDDGTRVPRAIIATAAALLGDAGLLVLEHADTQGAALRLACAEAGLATAETRRDYTGRDRFTLAARQPHL